MVWVPGTDCQDTESGVVPEAVHGQEEKGEALEVTPRAQGVSMEQTNMEKNNKGSSETTNSAIDGGRDTRPSHDHDGVGDGRDHQRRWHCAVARACEVSISVDFNTSVPMKLETIPFRS
eukprot:576003-Amphidinium_carterae.1